ncbi:MAG: cyclic-di-AMP receptor, partial [Anaerolineales bacterium]|nr:cyclic-di-AMP receptor [Anaerolineales bacterium]
VVLFNLLVQGISLGPLVRRLKLVERSPAQDEYERRHARAVASRAALAHLQRRYQEGLISAQTWQSLARLLEQRIEALSRAVSEVMHADPKVETEELDTAWREALLAKRSAYSTLLRDGIITEDTFGLLIGEVDQGLTGSQINWGNLMRSLDLPEAQVLLTAFVHADDAENAVEALNRLGVGVTRLPSQGGLLRQRSVTLLLGVPEPQVKSVLRTLEGSCRRRVQARSSLLESLPIQLPGDRLFEIGGATIFSFEIERYEEI